MIRIDEIYNNTFWPYIEKNIPGASMYYHGPFGRSDPESILYKHPPNGDQEHSYIYFFDQEAVYSGGNRPTWMSIQARTRPTPGADPRRTIIHGQKGVMVTSELDSRQVDRVAEYLKARPFYYFFHGWAALDWYRGYDRTYLITPPEDRKIGKTFISPNRIIGGERLHRVAMLYHFEKHELFHNHVSAPRICPVEGQDIVDISSRLITHYPDIKQVLGKSKNLPRTFSGEDTQEMHSCWLSLFDECAESLLYHVTETAFFGEKLHLTEKTFKPIAMGMPFVLTSTAGSLAYLRSYGFKTFGHLWDESYDQETSDYKRLDKIASLLGDLDQMSQAEKQQMFEEAMPTIRHNWEHFYHGNFEQILWKEMNDMLEQIRDHLGN